MDSGDDFMKTGRAATRTLAHDAGEPALRVQLSPGQNGAPDHYLTTRSYLAEVCAAKGAQFPNESIELDVFVLCADTHEYPYARPGDARTSRS